MTTAWLFMGRGPFLVTLAGAGCLLKVYVHLRLAARRGGKQ